ncbi:type 1 glutamine amidotransferase [Isoptericola sp. NPDC019693]|uniref:type 1 glutamine amidotransferase n=1 Tax=Isoptericola sp. NPDC019693 TaxID=3364009 RepID=UPI003796A887
MPDRRPTVVLVQNSPHSGPGRLPAWLEADGVAAVVVQGADVVEQVASLAEGGAAAPDGVDGLVLLGGGLLPDEDERAPWLPHERALVAEALDAGVPVLGICLGGQVLAHVAGGTVTGRSGETEKGLCPVRLLDAAADDALLGPLGALAVGGEVRMVESHVDSITGLPPQAVHLATSDACVVQAFRVGDVAWGLQFHPEAAPERIGTWDADELATLGFDRDALLAAALERAPENERQARALAAAFAAVVHRCERDSGDNSGPESPRNRAHNASGVR